MIGIYLVQIPKTIKKGKDVKVILSKQHIRVDINEGTGFSKVIDSDLAWPIRSEESTWSLVPGEYIHVY